MITTYILLRTEEFQKELPATVEGYAAKQLDTFTTDFTDLLGESDMKKYLIDYMNERYETTVEKVMNDEYHITEYLVCKLNVPECRSEDKEIRKQPINYYWCGTRCGLEILATSKYKGGKQ